MFSRAYISFKAPEQLATFSQSYDGHAFKDKQGVWVHPCLVALGRRFIRWIGNEYHAVVEFAPYQKVPSAPKNDNRQGTIEDGTFFSLFRYTTFIGLTFQPFTLDEDFKSFVASLSAPDAPVETVAEPISPQKSTPLLEALIQSKEKANKRSGPGGVLTILSRTQQLKEDEQHFSRTSPIVPAEERAITGAGGSEKEGGNVKGRGKRSAPPIQPGTPSTPKPQKPRQVSGGKPAASTTKQPAPAAAPSGDQQRAATPTKNRAPLPASSPDEARKKKRAKERAKKEKEKGKDKDKDRDEDEDDPNTPGSSGHQQAQAGGSREKLARKTTPGQPIPAASSSSQAQRGRTASVGAASESGPAQVQEGEPKSPTAERGRGRGRGGGGWGSSGRGRGGRGGAKEVDKMGVQVRIIQRPAPIVAPPAAPSEPALVSTHAPPPAENAGAEGGDGGTVPDGNPGGGGGGGESRGGRGGQRGWRGRGRGGNYRGRGGRGRGE